MEIATREVRMTITMDYNDGCTKKIHILKYYVGNEKTPVLRYKQVELRYPDGTIDEDRSDVCKLIIDENDDFGTEYTELEIEMLKTIHYNDNSTKTIKIWKIYNDFMKKSAIRHKMVEFRHPDGTIDKYRSNDIRLFN